MRINVMEAVKSYDGKNILDEKQEPVSFRTLFYVALNSTLRDEILGAEQKSKIYQLTSKLYKDKEVELTLDERALIKERAAKILEPLSYGRVCDVLEDKKETK